MPKMINDYREQLADERLATERTFLLTVLARKARESCFTRRKNVSKVDQATMAGSELHSLEQTVRVARERLAELMRKENDPAAIEVATDICLETIAAVRSFLAQRK